MTNSDVKLFAQTPVLTVFFLTTFPTPILSVNTNTTPNQTNKKQNTRWVEAESTLHSKNESQHQRGACSPQTTLGWVLSLPWGDLLSSEPQLPVWLHTLHELGPSSSTHPVEGREKHTMSSKGPPSSSPCQITVPWARPCAPGQGLWSRSYS